jgi:hypothetical protein
MRAPNLPTALPSGSLIPHLSARRRHEVCDIVFEMLGGVEKLHYEAGRDREAYWEFMRLWSKGLPRAVATEHSATEGVENLLAQLEQRKKDRMVDITPENVTVIDESQD